MSQEPQYPSEPLPRRDLIVDEVKKLWKEVGTENLTRRVLMKRLGSHFKIDFAAHKKLLDEIVVERMQEPAIKKEVARATKAREEKAEKKSKSKGKSASDKSPKKDKDKKDKEKKKKREKAEGEPKKAMSGFFFYSNDIRPEILARMRGADGSGKVDVKIIGAEIGERWKVISEADKQKYEAMAAKDKERYKSEFDTWTAGGGKKISSKSHKEKDPNAPKRPMNPSFAYVNAKRDEFRKAHPEMKLTEVTKALCEEYKSLTDGQRKPFEDKYAAERAAYAVATGKTVAAVADASPSSSSSSSGSSSDEE